MYELASFALISILIKIDCIEMVCIIYFCMVILRCNIFQTAQKD